MNVSVSWCCPAILLHRAKADLTLLDENKNTALHLACSKVHITVIHKILECVMRYTFLECYVTLIDRSPCIYSLSFSFVHQAHEMCALLILGEIHSPTLINATNSALQM